MRRRLDALSRSPGAIILNLHRVAPMDGSSYPALCPEIFEALLKYVRANFYVQTIENLASVRLAARPSARSELALSFDDGYLDFYTYAMPLLAKYGIRVNQNIIPACIETGRPPFNVVAQDFVGKAPTDILSRLDVPGFSEPIGPQVGNSLSAFLKNRPKSEMDKLEAYLLPQFAHFEEFVPTRMMDIEQVREVARSHEIGAHSYSHASLAYESYEFVRNDVRQCQAYFRDRLSCSVKIYALPNGSYRPEQLQIIHDEGVGHILFVGETFAVEALNRFTFDAVSKSEMRYKATGRSERIPK